MLKGIFDEVWQLILDKLGGLVTPLLDYLYIAEWLGACIGIIVLCAFIANLAPFDFVKKALGWIASLAVTAGTVAFIVWKHFRDQKAAKPPPPTKAPLPKNGGWNW